MGGRSRSEVGRGAFGERLKRTVWRCNCKCISTCGFCTRAALVMGSFATVIERDVQITRLGSCSGRIQ